MAGLGEKVVRLGVTGLARSGKTVFLTSLVSNLLEPKRMVLLSAANRIEASYLQPQPDDTVPRFDYESHLAALTATTPKWPQSTRSISEIRVSMRLARGGLFGAYLGPKLVHVDFVDYPGEWLLDLTLLDTDYATWSMRTLGRLARRKEALGFLGALPKSDRKLDEGELREITQRYVEVLQALRDAGYSDCTPGRFLLPGDLAGSPALTFVPLAPTEGARRGTLFAECERRYNAYCREVVMPFFRSHFAKIDRQIVLVDVLGALHAGPEAFDNLRLVMGDVMRAFRPGRTSILGRLLGSRRVSGVLLAATKADHIHHRQHGRLQALTEALLAEARQRAAYLGAETAALSLASLRATVETRIDHRGEALECVQGWSNGKVMAYHAGDLPENPQDALTEARQGETTWLASDYGLMDFAPPPSAKRPGEGLVHLRLDRAAEFLLGDLL